MEIKEKERIDDLEYKGLKIIQKQDGFCFGIDSVLLSDFAKNIKKETIVVDLGTGTGILPILLSAKTQAKKIYGIEIQKDMAEMAKRSVLLNHLEKKIEIIPQNIKEIAMEKASIDVIVTNPPYKKDDTGLKNENISKRIARHEIYANLEDFIQISFQLLKDKGEFYMVHRPERLVDILYELRKNKIEPKKIKFVHSHVGDEPKLVLIKAVKNAKPFLSIEKPLYIYTEQGKYTKEILEIYHKEEGEK